MKNGDTAKTIRKMVYFCANVVAIQLKSTWSCTVASFVSLHTAYVYHTQLYVVQTLTLQMDVCTLTSLFGNLSKCFTVMSFSKSTSAMT